MPVLKVYDGTTQIEIGGTSDLDAIHDNVAGEIAAVTEKAGPVDADLLLVEDSADGNAKKRVQAGNLPGGGDTHPMVDTTELVKGSGDDTKIAKIECDTNIPTSTTVIVDWPSADLDLENVKDHLPATSDAHGATQDITTRLDVGNVRLSGNSVTTTIFNGDIILQANGTGDAVLRAQTGKCELISDTVKFTPGADTDMVLEFNGTTKQANITYMEDEDRFDFDAPVDVAGNITLTGTVDGRDIATDGGVLDTAMQDLVDDTTPQLGGELDCQAHTVGFTLQTATGDGTTTIDWTAGNKFKFTFGAQNETFTFSPSPTGVANLVLTLKQDGVGGRTVTWPAGVIWPNQTAPTLSVAANARDLIAFYWDGTEYWGGILPDYG